MSYDYHCDHHGPRHRSAAGRHRRRHGFGGGRGDLFGGEGGIPGGRRLGAADLQLLVLALLAERPAHGYELIRTVEERSGGFYTPSPGVIYPALTFLEEIGEAAVEVLGQRKLYRITGDGHARLARERERADAILAALTRIGGRMAEVRAAFAGHGERGPEAADAFHHARHALKDALARKRGCDAQEVERITAVLERAAAEIIGRA